MNNVVFTTEVDKYNFFEEKSPSRYTRRCINNKIIGSNKCVGYCQYSGHPGFLTKDLLEQHNCIEKGCDYFVIKPSKEKSNTDNYDISALILTHARNSFSSNEGIKIMNVKNAEYKKYKVFYVAITSEYSFDDYISVVLDIYDVNITFVRLNYDFETCATLICTN